MSFENPNVIESDVDKFYETFLEQGYFHNDQTQYHEKSFVKLTSFFEKEFTKRSGKSIKLGLGTNYDPEWGTIAWFCSVNLDYNTVKNEINEYIKVSKASSNFS